MKNLKGKVISFVTVLTCLSMMAPGLTQAATAEELQAQINSLLATLSQLQSQLTTLQGGTTGGVTGCTISSFARNLSQGMSGDDVKCLQIILNSNAATQVAASGTGSSGSETTYFGALTKAAVVKFQNTYAADCLTPLGLTAGTGFVGAKTRAKLDTFFATGGGGVIIPPVVVPTGAGLTVTLASSTAAAGTIVAGQSLAPLASYVFTNGDSSEVKVTTLKLKRIGVSADASLTNIYLFDGATRLTDAASVSSSVVTFNDPTGLFKVAAGGSKTITVSSDICTLTSCTTITGETMGMSLAVSTDVGTTASAVKGTYPINGNFMTVASATLAGASFNTTTTPSGGSVDPQTDYIVWQNIVTVTTRAVNMTRLSLREIGTVNYVDLQNFKLFVDGVQVGSTVANLDANGYVTFDLSASPKRLEAGSRTLKMSADIIGGSSRTFSFSLRIAADANFVDTQYGVNVLPQANNTTFTARSSCASTCTISAGTMTVSKTSDSPSGTVVNSSAATTLAKYTLKAAGEKVKIESLQAEVIWVNTDSGAGEAVGTLRNGMLLANGVQVGSTASIDVDTTTADGSGTTFNLGSSLIVDPLSPVTLSVVADVYDNDSGGNHLENNDTLQVNLILGVDNAQGQVSLTILDVPSAATTGNQVTIGEGSLTVAKYTAYTNQSAVVPKQAVKLAHFVVTAATTEAINLNTINVDWDTVSQFDASSDLSNLYVKYGANTTTTKATVADTANSWSVNAQIAGGSTMDVTVYADVASGAYSDGSDYGAASLTVTGTTVSSAASVAPAEVTGQVVAFVTGTLTAKADAATPLAQIVAGNQTVTAAKFKFESKYEDYKINELWFKVGATNAGAVIVYAILKDGSTILATKPFDTTKTNSNDTVYFTGLTTAVAANTSKTLTVDLILSIPSSDASTDQQNVAITMWKDKYSDSQGVQYTDDSPETSYAAGATDASGDPAGNAMYVYRSIPTVTVGTLPTSVLTTGTSQTLYKFTMGANAQGEVDVKQLKFTVTTTDGSAGGTEVLDTFKFYRGSDDITSSVTIQSASAEDLESATDYVTEGAETVVVTFNTEEAIPAGTTYTYSLKATSTDFASSTSGKDTVATTLLGDATAHNGSDVYLYEAGGSSETAVQQLAEAAAGTNNSNYNFIWSDNSGLSHSYTIGSSTADWANGYLVLNLPLDSLSLQVP